VVFAVVSNGVLLVPAMWVGTVLGVLPVVNIAVVLTIRRWWQVSILAAMGCMIVLILNITAAILAIGFAFRGNVGAMLALAPLLSVIVAFLTPSPEAQLPEDACASCGYDLTGLAGRRCPECGEEHRMLSGSEAESSDS
jgi:hypothetical protein